MKLYAETPRRRARQIVVDSCVVAWAIVWIAMGMVAHDVVASLAGPTRAVATNSDELADSLFDISDSIDEVPLVGGGLEEPFTAAGRAAAGVADQSRKQEQRFLTAALWIGLLIAVAPIAAVLLLYLPFRTRWIREATSAARIRLDSDDLYLFALRAVSNRRLSELRRASPDPGAALASGDYEALARVELEHLGLKV